jgi:hypothetical protein
VQLTADALASNHTSKHIKNVNGKKRKVILPGVHHPAEVLQEKDLQEEKAQEVVSK